jgi:hypothetical protein
MEPGSGPRISFNEYGIWTYFIIWLLLVVNGFLVVYLNYGLPSYFILKFLLITCFGAVIIYYVVEQRKRKVRGVPPDIANVVDLNLTELTDACNAIYSLEIENRITPLLKNAEDEFKESLTFLWQNGEKLRRVLDEGLSQIKVEMQSFVHLFRQEDLIPNYKAVMARLDSCLQTLNDAERFQEKGAEELALIFRRLGSGFENRLNKEKDAAINYLQELLVSRIAEAPGANSQASPGINLLTEQFRSLLVNGIQDKLPGLDDQVATALEDLATRVTGSIQNFGLNQLNGFIQMIEAVQRLAGEGRKNNDLVARLNGVEEELNLIKDTTNDMLFSLAWQEIMLEKRWQQLNEQMAPMRENVLGSIEPAIQSSIQNTLERLIRGFIINSVDDRFREACQDLMIAEILGLALEDGSTPEVWDGSLVLFQYVYALEGLARRTVFWPREYEETRHILREEVKKGLYQDVFNDVLLQLNERNPELKLYLLDIFPKQFVNFCSTADLYTHPANCGQAGWMLMFYLLDMIDREAQEYRDLAYLVSLLLTVQAMRNRYIHPTKSSQFIKLDSKERLDEIRSATINAYNMIFKRELAGKGR